MTELYDELPEPRYELRELVQVITGEGVTPYGVIRARELRSGTWWYYVDVPGDGATYTVTEGAVVP